MLHETPLQKRGMSFSQKVSWEAWVIINNYRTLNPPFLSLSLPGFCNNSSSLKHSQPGLLGHWDRRGKEQDAERPRGKQEAVAEPAASLLSH